MQDTTRKLAGIGLLFESCDSDWIPAKYIKSLKINNLDTTVELQDDGTMKTTYSCETFMMCLAYPEVNKQLTSALKDNGYMAGLCDRLISYCDVTWVTLDYSDGSSMELRLPWNFRGDTYNCNMFTDTNKDNTELGILVSSNETMLRERKWQIKRLFD